MSETFHPDILFGGSQVLPIAEARTLALGQNLSRGAALGKVLYALGAPAAAPGNTGNGTCAAALPAAGETPRIGAYAITCEVQADPGPPAVIGQFRVTTPQTPQGVLILANGTPQIVEGVQIALTEGVATWVVGDAFTLALAAGSGECVQLASTAANGSQHLDSILADDVDATAAAKECAAYVEGEFNALAVGFAGADTAATFKAEGEAKRIFFRDTVSA